MYTLDKIQGDVTMVKEYEKRIEIILKPLGIVTTNSNSNLRRYAESDLNAFNEIKKLFIHTYVSYNEEDLNQAINNMLKQLYLIED